MQRPNMREEGRWSRGMIPRLQRGDQEFESPPAHLYIFFILKS
jgi:hypothetical protein